MNGWMGARGAFWRLVAVVLMTTLIASPSGLPAGAAQGVSDAPVPVDFPRDDGPHDVAVEWWYYTGHLFTAARERYGFEFVFFKGQRGSLEGYAAHFAVTDGGRGRFQYDQRLVPAEGVSRAGEGFDLRIGEWGMRGANGEDVLRAAMEGYAIDVRLQSEKDPALHDGDGYIDYGNGTASYYYSRTRMAAEGSMVVDGERVAVTGEAWMDHQWGDFSTFTDGGWDWFAVQLEDGSDLMLYVIRGPAGEELIVDGSYVAPDGELTVLEAEDFEIRVDGRWTSPRSGGKYPALWTIRVPGQELEVEVVPTLADQELDTSATTGVTYWEGEVEVAGTRDGKPATGLGYVELTGYVPVANTPLG